MIKGEIIEGMLDKRLDLSRYYTTKELADILGFTVTDLSYKARKLDFDGSLLSITAGTKSKPIRAYKVNPDSRMFKSIITKRTKLGIDDTESINTIR